MNYILKSGSTSKQGPGEQLKYIGAVEEWPRTGRRAERSQSGKVAKCRKAGKRGKVALRECTERGNAGRRREVWARTGICAERPCAEPRPHIACSHRSRAHVRSTRSTRSS